MTTRQEKIAFLAGAYCVLLTQDPSAKKKITEDSTKEIREYFDDAMAELDGTKLTDSEFYATLALWMEMAAAVAKWEGV